MFSVYCSWHGTDVLLGPNAIEGMHNDGKGFSVRWRCTCGNTGVDRIGAAQSSPEPVEAAAC